MKHTLFARWIPAAFLLAAVLAAPSAFAQDKSAGKRDVDTIVTEQRLRRMVTTLELSEEQKEKVRPIILAEVKNNRALRENPALTEAQRLQKEKEFYEANKAKLKEAMTEEQFAKYEKSREPKPRKP